MGSLRKVERVVKTVRAENEEFAIRALAIFCAVGREEGIFRKDLGKQLQMSDAVVGRHEFSLVKMDLISALPSATDPKSGKVYYLTQKGRDFLELLVEAVKED